MSFANLFGIHVGTSAPSELTSQNFANQSDTAPPVKSLFVTVQSLTFSGVTIIGGVALNFITANIGGSRFWVALGVAVVLGLIVTIVSIHNKDTSWQAGNKAIALVIALVNTFVLWVSLFGISSIPNPLVPAS